MLRCYLYSAAMSQESRCPMRSWQSLVVLLLAALALPALAQIRSTQPKVQPRKDDIKYIKCQVCELLAKNAYRQVKDMFKAATPSSPVTEEAVIDRVEKMANPAKDEGEWVAKIDLVEKGSQLLAKEMNEVGDCGVECKTIERAAQDILDQHDTDIGEALFVGKKTRSQFSNWLCYELTNACSKKPPALPKDRAPGPAFAPVDPEKLKLDKMLAGMQEQGMRGSLYSREEAMAQYMRGKGGEDDDEDDDEGEQPAASPAGGSGGAGAANDHPLNNLATAAVEQGQELLSKAKDAAASVVESASAGIQKARDDAMRLWNNFKEGRKKKEEEAEL